MARLLAGMLLVSECCATLARCWHRKPSVL